MFLTLPSSMRRRSVPRSLVYTVVFVAMVAIAACVAPRDTTEKLPCSNNAQCPANGKWYCDIDKKECTLCEGACPGAGSTTDSGTTTDTGSDDDTTTAADATNVTDAGGSTDATTTADATTAADTGAADTGASDVAAEDAAAADTGPAVKTCKNWCGKSDSVPGTICYCDTSCLQYEDCCPDFKTVCPDLVPTDAGATSDATSPSADATSTGN